VLDTSGRFYCHAKQRGTFHHSSFLRGGAVLSAGGIVVEAGRIVKLTADSGHYRWEAVGRRGGGAAVRRPPAQRARPLHAPFTSAPRPPPPRDAPAVPARTTPLHPAPPDPLPNPPPNPLPPPLPRPDFNNFVSTVQLLRDWGADLSRARLSAKHIDCPLGAAAAAAALPGAAARQP
jgi:hypothetical protein